MDHDRVKSLVSFLSDSASTVSLSASQTFTSPLPRTSSVPSNEIIERAKKRIEILKERSLTAENEVSRLQQKVMELQNSLSSLKSSFDEKLSEESKKADQAVRRASQNQSKLNEEKAKLEAELAHFKATLDQLKIEQTKKLELAAEHTRKEAERAALAARSHERSRCEKIMQKRIAEIRQDTIKGLEPEIARLISSHKDAEKRLKEEYDRELAVVRSNSTNQLIFELDQQRQSLNNERIAALERERELNRQKINQINDTHDELVANLRRRHSEEVSRILAESRANWTTEENIQFKKFDHERSEILAREGKLQKKIENLESELQSKNNELIKMNSDWMSSFDCKVDKEVSSRLDILIDQKTIELKSEFEIKLKEKLAIIVSKLESDNLELENQIKAEYAEIAQNSTKELTIESERVKKELNDLKVKYQVLIESSRDQSNLIEQSQKKIQDLEVDNQNLAQNLEEELKKKSDCKKAEDLRVAKQLASYETEISKLKENLEEKTQLCSKLEQELGDTQSTVEQKIQSKFSEQFENLENMARTAVESKNNQIKQLEDVISDLQSKLIEKEDQLIRQAEELLDF
ncbi:hypothetical protein RCL1_001482 [Eukaryota sp. TZLM3-RCL]